MTGVLDTRRRRIHAYHMRRRIHAACSRTRKRTFQNFPKAKNPSTSNIQNRQKEDFSELSPWRQASRKTSSSLAMTCNASMSYDEDTFMSLRRRKHACHMWRLELTGDDPQRFRPLPPPHHHMRRRIHACHMRRRIHASNASGRSRTPTALSVRC
jgi:hypothetical protein